MSEVLPSTGICTGGVSTNIKEFTELATAMANLKLAFADTAVGMGVAATTAALVAVDFKTLQVQISKSNRGAAVGVKGATSGSNIATLQAVITRRNSLAGPTDQFPVPPTPPNI